MDSGVAERVQKCFKNHITDTNIQVAKTHHNSSTYSCGTRLAIIEFPHLNGDYVKQWIYHCETYFSIDGMPEEVKTKLIVVNLEGKALQ